MISGTDRHRNQILWFEMPKEPVLPKMYLLSPNSTMSIEIYHMPILNNLNYFEIVLASKRFVC